MHNTCNRNVTLNIWYWYDGDDPLGDCYESTPVDNGMHACFEGVYGFTPGERAKAGSHDTEASSAYIAFVQEDNIYEEDGKVALTTPNTGTTCGDHEMRPCNCGSPNCYTWWNVRRLGGWLGVRAGRQVALRQPLACDRNVICSGTLC